MSDKKKYKILEKNLIEDSIDCLVEFDIDLSEFNLDKITKQCKIYSTQPQTEEDVLNEIESRVNHEIKKHQTIERNKIIINKI